MSECHKYAAGVPCWVDTLQPDPQAAADFYGRLFGWTFNSSDSTPETPAARYLLAESRGREVAGVAPQTGGARPTPVWNTYVSVADVDKTAKKAIDAGGRVLVAPVDVNDAGRMAVLEDPWEASIGVWEPRGRQGAQCINEAGAGR